MNISITTKQREKIAQMMPAGSKVIKTELLATNHKQSLSRKNYKSIKVTYLHGDIEKSVLVSSKVGHPISKEIPQCSF